jgi:hypothetical protein
MTLNENDDISSQHEEIDSKLFYFLIRRLHVNERELGGNWGDFTPLKVKEYSFNGYDSKKTMERKIIEMLYENDIIEYLYDMDERDPKRVKIIKTIRKFIKFMLSDQK